MRARLAATLVIGLVLGALVAAQGAPLPALRNSVAVIAHRGGAGLAPENTLAALRNAVALGVDYVEIDVRATRDRQLVLLHDSSVDRTTDGHGQVAQLTFAQVRALDAGSKFGAAFAGERIPTLDEALAFCRGRVNVYLDHKEGPRWRIDRIIRKHHMERSVLVYDGVQELQCWKRMAPDIPVMPSPGREDRRPGGLAALLQTLPAEALDGGAHEWNAALVKDAHACGARVYVDIMGPFDNAAGYKLALAMGVDGLQTDYPDRLLGLLRAR